MQAQPVDHADPIKNDVAERLARALTQVYRVQPECWSAAKIVSLIERPKDAAMGDLAFPCFRLAKELKAAPPVIAQTLAKAFEQDGSPWISKVAPAGPFVNFFVNADSLAKLLIPKVLSGAYFEEVRQSKIHSDRVMIEYSQPNTHKEFHVGHMRNVALGDSLVQLYRYCGYDVIAANYIGDEGVHIAKCLWYIDHFGKKPPAQGKGEWLGAMYSEANLFLEDANEADAAKYKEEISAVLRQIESKSGPYYETWKETRQWSLDVFDTIYEWLGSKFDHFFYESEVSEESQAIVDEYLKKGIMVESEGAIGVDLKPYKLGFALYRKRDGNTLYATKDLALARRKFEKYKIDKSIYVVASEQNLHFQQVFKTLDLMGFPQAKQCYHLSYGLVVLPEGKMASRSGNVITFAKLQQSLNDELDKPLEKYQGIWSQEEIEATRHKLCVGAIKFGMIFSDPNKEIVFDLKDWLSFEGCTGPYLMYSYARSSSIITKAREAGFEPSFNTEASLSTNEEAEVLKQVQLFNETAQLACEANKPSILAHYLFDLCKAFNRLHKNVPIIKAETTELRSSRLALILAFGKILRQGLALLAFSPPDRM
jgi:arginyl-tRNA synthetase